MKILMLSISIFIYLSFCRNDVKGQELTINGAIFEKGTKIRIALAVITNKQNGKGVGSNDMGVFQIKAKIGDTLFIKKRNFITQQIVIKNQQDVLINLIRLSNMLEDVTIRGNTKIEDLDEVRREFKRQGSFYEGKPPLALLNPFGGSPLTFFYELFGKTPAKARRFKKYYSEEVKLMQIDQFFNKTLITKYTDLKGKDIDRFLIEYYPSADLIKNWNIYDAASYIKLSAKKYTDRQKK